MARHPIPRPSILDGFEPLGFIYGERRWRDARGRLYTWDGRHGELELYTARGRHLGAVDPVTGDVLKPAVEGRRIRSDVTTYLDDVVTGRSGLDALDDYIDRWHDGEGQGATLHAFLGLTWEEYGAWIKNPDALGAIVAARRSARAPSDMVA